MTSSEVFTAQEEVERDARLDRWLTEFHTINDPELQLFRFNARKSWEAYVSENAFRLAHDMAFEPETLIKPREENSVHSIRVRTTSKLKWLFLSQLITDAGFEPLLDRTPFDEENEHEWRRKQNDFPRHYPTKVASSKQSFDLLQSPLITLDTVILVNDIPLEKPHDAYEAEQFMTRVNGQHVSTETGWMIGMPAKSGASIHLHGKVGIEHDFKLLSLEIIKDYMRTSRTQFDVPVGFDLKTKSARSKFIDMTKKITYYSENMFYGEEGYLTLDGFDLQSQLFDSFFAGVPVYAIRALLPLLNNFYLHGDEIFEEQMRSVPR